MIESVRDEYGQTKKKKTTPGYVSFGGIKKKIFLLLFTTRSSSACAFALGGNLYYPISSFGLIFSAAYVVVHMLTEPYTHTALTLQLSKLLSSSEFTKIKNKIALHKGITCTEYFNTNTRSQGSVLFRPVFCVLH